MILHGSTKIHSDDPRVQREERHIFTVYLMQYAFSTNVEMYNY